MKLQVLAAGAAVLALTVGAASAATNHRTHARTAGAFAEPSQPIAYAKLDQYLKASPRQRERGDWGLETGLAATAPTGTAANAAAQAPGATPSDNANMAPNTAPDSTQQAAPPAAAPQDQSTTPSTPAAPQDQSGGAPSPPAPQ